MKRREKLKEGGLTEVPKRHENLNRSSGGQKMENNGFHGNFDLTNLQIKPP